MKKLFLFTIFIINVIIGYSQTPISVTVDSIRQKSDTIYLTDRKGSICWMRTSGDSLYLGDISGEIYLGVMTQGGTSYDTINTRLVRFNTTVPIPSQLQGQLYWSTAKGTLALQTGTNTYYFGDSIFVTVTGDTVIANTYLDVNGNANLNGILFTGSTKTAGAFYTGTTSPTNTNYLNYDGILRATQFYSLAPSGTIALHGSASGGGNGLYTETLNSTGGTALNSYVTGNGRAGQFISAGSTTNSQSLIYLSRQQGGTASTTGDIISIVDSPSTTGTISGAILSATIGSTERISLNPRSTRTGTAYILDTDSLLTTGSIISIRNQGNEIFKITPEGYSVNGGDVIATSDTVNALTAIQEHDFDSLTANKINADTLELGIIWHAVGGFEDSTITVTISAANTWYHGTNATHNAVIGLDAAGFSISGDTLICLKSGDFRGMLSVTWSGTVGNEYQFRAYNITQARQIAFKQGQTSGGAASYDNVSFPLYEEITAGDRVVFQVQNISAANNIILRHYQFEAVYLHE